MTSIIQVTSTYLTVDGTMYVSTRSTISRLFTNCLLLSSNLLSITSEFDGHFYKLWVSSLVNYRRCIPDLNLRTLTRYFRLTNLFPLVIAILSQRTREICFVAFMLQSYSPISRSEFSNILASLCQ
jgi:hypothetical protein